LPDKSRTHRKLSPSNEWGWQELLLNNLLHSVNILSWQLSGDPKVPMPEQWWPDFIPKPKPKKSEAMKDAVTMDIDDLKAFLSKPRQNATVESNEPK
jgi:hypothetical protein